MELHRHGSGSSAIDYTVAAEWLVLKHRYWDMLHPKDRKSLAHKKAPAA